MAVILRDMGVPTRLVEGFLPGTREAGGIERVPMSSAHVWVEVYFPGFGWVQFDPTGGALQRLVGPLPSDLADGERRATSLDPERRDQVRRSRSTSTNVASRRSAISAMSASVTISGG